MMINYNSGIMPSKRYPFETEAKKWHFHLMNNPEQFEREAFIDRMNEINFAIKEFRRLYEKAPETDDLFRAKVLREIERSKRSLAKIQTEYEMFKKYRMRTAKQINSCSQQ
jgi:hypothetical protein